MYKGNRVGIAHSKSKKLLVLNRKGGVGKSTFTASLLSRLIQKGRKVELIDFDRQCTTYYWSLGVQSFPSQSFNPNYRNLLSIGQSLKVARDSELIVIDSPPNFSDPDLSRYLKFADYIIIPMQPSPVDLHSSLPFIHTLLHNPHFNLKSHKVGCVINRCSFGVEEHVQRVKSLLSLLSQFSFLGCMSEFRGYQDCFLNRTVMTSTETDSDLWDQVLLWLEETDYHAHDRPFEQAILTTPPQLLV
ncbi:ParA family protein [Vibrio sp. F13]|uniref:ParA family protein n=1 Tax=Vibrio sp. F13 TaxID=2070777 RepID=UPI0010BD03D8|nr:ParA family protein [Vibrio sp. F13]TKG09022.1 ParA family protein [Vibrio sp. F13]